MSSRLATLSGFVQAPDTYFAAVKGSCSDRIKSATSTVVSPPTSIPTPIEEYCVVVDRDARSGYDLGITRSRSLVGCEHDCTNVGCQTITFTGTLCYLSSKKNTVDDLSVYNGYQVALLGSCSDVKQSSTKEASTNSSIMASYPSRRRQRQRRTPSIDSPSAVSVRKRQERRLRSLVERSCPSQTLAHSVKKGTETAFECLHSR